MFVKYLKGLTVTVIVTVYNYFYVSVILDDVHLDGQYCVRTITLLPHHSQSYPASAILLVHQNSNDKKLLL